MDWKDTTSRSRGEVDRTPRVWTATCGPISIVVHRHRDYGSDVWLLSMRGDLALDKKELKSKDVEAAKSEAVGEVRLYLTRALAALGDE